MAVYRYRDPQWPAPEVVAVALQVTGRDRAHGRPGRFVEVDPDGFAEPLQLTLL